MSRKMYFNQMAECWDQTYYTPKLEAFLEKIVPMFGLKLGERVLDLGTGTGVLIPFLIRTVGSSGSVKAIDYSENMIIKCREKHSHIKNLTIELQDVEELDLPPEHFDIITCFGLFPHIDDEKKALKNMYSTLKSGGKLIIAHALSSDEIKSHHNDIALSVSHDMLPEKREMRRLLKKSGFRKIIIIDKPGCYLCRSNKP